MEKIIACIDGQPGTHAVVEGAVWAARTLAAPLQLLHVLERHPERAASTDASGTIGFDAQDALLRELSALDQQRGQIAQEAGRRLLAAARARAEEAGVPAVDTLMRHGMLAETALELEPQARLFVLGHRPPSDTRPHLDHHLEQTVRSVHQPVLVVPGQAFAAPQRAVIAFDGSATAQRLVARVAASPLLVGLPIVLAMAGEAARREALAQAERTLRAAGFSVASELLDGEPDAALPARANAKGTLLVIGAYGHWRIRRFIVGSTTTALLRASSVPVLVLR